MMTPESSFGSYRHALAGINDYDWTKLPALTDSQKKQVADIVDGFKTSDDVVAWVKGHGRGTKGFDEVIFGAVPTVADQKFKLDAADKFIIHQQVSTQTRGGVLVFGAGDPTAAYISEADGYAYTLIKAGALTQESYDAQKATAKGTGWTIASATAFRDAVKKALDDYNAKAKPTSGWLIPAGIAIAAFLATRK